MQSFMSSLVIFYVDIPLQSAEFYADLLQIQPLERSETFVLFAMDGSHKLGLWSKQTVSPQAEPVSQCAEYALQLATPAMVDERRAACLEKGITIVQAPVQLDFGYALTIACPDGHRLRFYHLC